MVARCTVDYVGRLTAHLPLATRVLMLKADGSVLVHSDGGSYKPLNWMSPPCVTLFERLEAADESGAVEVWTVTNKAGENLVINVHEVHSDSEHDLGIDPGLVKDGVEAHLQRLLAEQVDVLGDGWRLVRREYPTAIGPVDLLCKDAGGATVLNRDPLLAPVQGVFAAQEIKPQARVLAEDRGIRCVVLDYDALKGSDDPGLRLF
mgnify:CR=1 FL=1